MPRMWLYLFIVAMSCIHIPWSVSAICDCGTTHFPPGREYGVIESPNYPQDYCGDLHCSHVIEQRPGWRIHITLVDAELESHSDYLYIISGQGSLKTNLASLTGCYSDTYKCRRNTRFSTNELTITDHAAEVVLSTNSYNNYRGFRLWFHRLPNYECSSSPRPGMAKSLPSQLYQPHVHVPNQQALMIVGHQPIQQTMPVSLPQPAPAPAMATCDCERVFFSRGSTSGIIQSPNYAKNGPACGIVNCTYVVEAKPGWAITLSVEDFELEPSSDHLEIYTRTTNASLEGNQLVTQLIANVTGCYWEVTRCSHGSSYHVTTPNEWSSSGGMLLTFVAGPHSESNGFSLMFKRYLTTGDDPATATVLALHQSQSHIAVSALLGATTAIIASSLLVVIGVLAYRRYYGVGAGKSGVGSPAGGNFAGFVNEMAGDRADLASVTTTTASSCNVSYCAADDSVDVKKA